jgi:site-specific recombinase XerD
LTDVESRLVFCREDGEPLSSAVVTHRFQDTLSEAKLPRQRFHDLRHAAASFMLAEGVSLRVVMEVLGHSEIGTTANIYGHVMPELSKDATDRVGKLLGGERDRVALKSAVNGCEILHLRSSKQLIRT